MKTKTTFDLQNSKNNNIKNLIFKKEIILDNNDKFVCRHLGYLFKGHFGSSHICKDNRNDIKHFISMGFGFPSRKRMVKIYNGRYPFYKSINVPNLLLILNMVKFNDIYWLNSIRICHAKKFNNLKLNTTVYEIYLDYFSKHFSCCPPLATIYNNKDINIIINSVLNGFWLADNNASIDGSIRYNNNTQLNSLLYNINHEYDKNTPMITDLLIKHLTEYDKVDQ